jgi:hypothetical protein
MSESEGKKKEGKNLKNMRDNLRTAMQQKAYSQLIAVENVSRRKKPE